MINRRTLVLGAAAAATLSACGVREPAGGFRALTPEDQNDGLYQLGAGDKVRITVFGEETLTGQYSVTGAGQISFPLIGNVPAAGLSVEQLQDSIRGRLAAGYLKDPRVSAEITDYRPYFILGEVNRPGQYPFSIGLTIEQAVAAAGGFTYRANTKRVFMKRALDTSERLVDMRSSPAVRVRPGDTIRVGERFF
jgi:polysaccharide export outer membrane protein